MYQLIFSNQTNLLPDSNRQKLTDVILIGSNSSNNEPEVCIRQGQMLFGYKYAKKNSSLLSHWNERVFNVKGDYPLSHYSWLAADKLLPHNDVIILRHPEGIRFYQFDKFKTGIELLKEDGNFHEVSDYTMLMGRFYPNTEWVGFMIRNRRREVKFYAVTQESFLPDEPDALFSLNTNLSFNSVWHSPNTDFFLTKLRHNEPSVIGLRTKTGLDFYQFNSDYLLEKIASTRQIMRPFKKKSEAAAQKDWIYFANLTHQIYQDILYLNNSGLYVYQYSKTKQDYLPLHHHPKFTSIHGWQPHFGDSIHLKDLNNDSRDDLIFTGPDGLIALSFDADAYTWRPLLNSNQLSTSQRYATIVSVLPAMPPAILQPSIITQDAHGKVQWARVVETTNPVILPQELKTRSTSNPNVEFSSSTSRYKTSPNSSVRIPEEMARKVLLEKPPVLRWDEQWNNNFLKEPVDVYSGQIKFNVPLIDIPLVLGFNYALALTYHSQVTSSELLGIGWSVPLAKDFIFADYKGSIYSEDADYYLVIQGYAQLLKFIAKKESDACHRFELANKQTNPSQVFTIEYCELAQRWHIDYKNEQAIYGRANDTNAADAVQLSLEWANWRGPGQDKEQLQPLVTAWYLNSRMAKHHLPQKNLYYQYEMDNSAISSGKTYTSAIRLKSITDGKKIRVSFNYASKTVSEFTTESSNPTDEQDTIIFPKSLVHFHYLQGYTVETANYWQNIQFVYQIENGQRLLTAIQQELFNNTTEPVLQFSYQSLLEKQLIKSLSLTSGIMVNFGYEIVTRPKISINPTSNMLSFRVGSGTKVAYGQDYAVIAYQDLEPFADHIILRFMNRKMSQTILDYSVIGPSKIKDYALQANYNWLMLLLTTDQSQVLYLFDRDNEKNWSTNPTRHSFSVDGLICFSETFIFVADSFDIRIYERVEEVKNQSNNWKTTSLSMPRAITRLAMHQRLVVGYDNYQLWLFYPDQSSQRHQWKRLVLADSNDTTHETLRRFCLTPDVQKQYLKLLNEKSLQIFNNFILLSSLNENNGQLSVNINLYLLNSKYKIAQQQVFKIERENVLSLEYDLKIAENNSVYRLGYVRKEGGNFEMKIKSASGDVVKDINEIRNKNLKEDAMIEMISQLNMQEKSQEFFQKSLLINLPLYFTELTQNGVYCGNDTFLRMTGSGWQREKQTPAQSSKFYLGKHFMMELIADNNNNRYLVKLYSKDPRQPKKPEQQLKELTFLPGRFINRYPVYLAFESTVNSVEVLTFKDEKTLGQQYMFNNEKLLMESDLLNILTVSNTSSTFVPQKCLVRPVITLTEPTSHIFVNLVNSTDGVLNRLTGYQHSFGTSDQKHQKLTYFKKVALIPGSNKNLHGWYEQKESYCAINSENLNMKTQKWFDANGKEVLPLEQQTSAHESPSASVNTSSELDNPALLWDRSGQLQISDFSPYSLKDEMVAYYGFESYENNYIGAKINENINSVEAKHWRLHEALIVNDRFSFTGENYLQLKATFKNASFLEGVFEPRDQDITYLTSCWLRFGNTHHHPSLNTYIPYYRAILSTTSGQEIFELRAQVKKQSGDWFYLEIPIDFQIFKQAYQDFANQVNSAENKAHNDATMYSHAETKFRIIIRIEALPQQILHIDHIRFSPFNFYFQANVYKPLTGQLTATIRTNGLVERTLYNRLHQKIASIQEDDQLEYFSSTSRTGRLKLKPLGGVSSNKTNHLVFHPENGFSKTFDSYALQNRWKLENEAAWRIGPGQLWHVAQKKHRIQADTRLFNRISAAIRCHFELKAVEASLIFGWKEIGSFEFIADTDISATLVLADGRTITPLPSTGEIIIMLSQNRVWLWLDGVLLLDQAFSTLSNSASPWSSFFLEAQDKVLLEDLLVMNNPTIRVEYLNAFGDITQVIQLVDERKIHVSETLYDELGRGAITTKISQIQSNPDQPLLAYRPNFVSNIDPASSLSVWHSGRLQGEVDELNPTDQGFAYKRTKFAPNPFNEEQVLGLPGKEYSIVGRYSTKLSRDSGIAFLENIFPSSQGYSTKVEHHPNESVRVAVFDKLNNQVALYVRVLSSYNHLLSTYEYDSERRLIKILPPLYHELVGTASKVALNGEANLTVQEKQYQQDLGTHFSYDDSGHLSRKITPDTGIVEYLHNSAGEMRFMVFLGANNQTEKILYFDYDVNGQLKRTGHLNQLVSIKALKENVESKFSPFDGQDYQLFNYADSSVEPHLSESIKQIVTYNQNEDGKEEVVIENIVFNKEQKIISKSALTMQSAELDQDPEFKKTYIGDKVNTLTYPVTVNGQPLHLVHHYNRLGQLVKICISDIKKNKTNDHYISFTYDSASGQLASEEYHINSQYNFTRSYSYNSPGFLTQLSDPFLTEEITYTEKGYGQTGFGDRMIVQAAFNASWTSNNADQRWFKIQEDEQNIDYLSTCFNALKRSGHLTSHEQPTKLYIWELETTLPLVCSSGKPSETLFKLMAAKQRPVYYGHRYSYGNHQELVKAKYFTDETESLIAPLQPHSFMEKIGEIRLNHSQSQHIWKLLTNAGYIINDQPRNDPATSIGKRGKSFFRDEDLLADLRALNRNYILYVEPIKKLFINEIAKRRSLSCDEFESAFLLWEDVDYHTSPRLEYNLQLKVAKQICQMLLDKNWLLQTASATINTLAGLDGKFTTTLKDFSYMIPEIVGVLWHHFAHALGETHFDLESYAIDANGNHKHFYAGFDRYELFYLF